MSAAVLVERLVRLGVRLRAEHDQLVVDAPRGVLTDDIRAELVASKPELLELIRERSLAEYAADRLPIIRFTIRETGETKRDFDLLGKIRHLIQEYQPGGNHVYLRIVPLDRKPVVVEWRALADRELRLALGRLLAREGLNDQTR